jgi:ADP-ribosylglycohydrolase
MGRSGIDKFTGCLLGGAIGDALGAPIEFMSLKSILNKYGKSGVIDYVESDDGKGRITDDTQMTLFTAEGLLRSVNRGIIRGNGGEYVQIIWHSYLRWLHTQQDRNSAKISARYDLDGWLFGNILLHEQRAPGVTCINALRSGICSTIEKPVNNSKGCGGVMRVAPVGLIFYEDPGEAFKIGAELAAITHGHPSGYLSAGAFAAIISFLNTGQKLENAIEESIELLTKWQDHRETLYAIRKAIDLFETTSPAYENVEKLGGGWVGEEALAISIYCALHFADNFEKAVTLAINHSGDSDSTGSITGNLVGLITGIQGISKDWIEKLELTDLISEVAEDLHIMGKSDFENENEELCRKYPPF